MTGCRALTPDEVTEISNSFYGKHATRNRCLFILGINTGFRVSELLSLKVRDVWNNAEPRGMIKVQRSSMKGKKRSREIYLNDKARQAVREWMLEANASPDAPLFHSQKGGAINRQQAHKILKAVFDDCHLDGTLATHTMRKTFADRVYGLTGDVFKVSTLLGHGSVDSTVSYLGMTTSEQHSIITRI